MWCGSEKTGMWSPAKPVLGTETDLPNMATKRSNCHSWPQSQLQQRSNMSIIANGLKCFASSFEWQEHVYGSLPSFSLDLGWAQEKPLKVWELPEAHD